MRHGVARRAAAAAAAGRHCYTAGMPPTTSTRPSPHRPHRPPPPRRPPLRPCPARPPAPRAGEPAPPVLAALGAAGGQALLLVSCESVAGIHLPYKPLLYLFAAQAIFNVTTVARLRWHGQHNTVPSDAELMAQMIVDLTALSAILFYTGGRHQSLHLVHYLPGWPCASAILPWRVRLGTRALRACVLFAAAARLRAAAPAQPGQRGELPPGRHVAEFRGQRGDDRLLRGAALGRAAPARCPS